MIRLSLCCLFFFFTTASEAQVAANDSGILQKAMVSARNDYMRSMNAGLLLYNGKAYERYWHGVKGHPFFLSNTFENGSLVYDGSQYSNVPLLYDMAHDVVVTKDFTGRQQVLLLTERISAFTIGSHAFIRIAEDSSQGASLSPGFYEVLYQDDQLKAIVKRRNQVVRLLKNEESYGLVGEGDNKFMEFDAYYLAKEGVYHSIKGESDLLSLFKERRQELRKFLNKKDIRYKKDPAGVIVQALSYYATLRK